MFSILGCHIYGVKITIKKVKQINKQILSEIATIGKKIPIPLSSISNVAAVELIVFFFFCVLRPLSISRQD